MTLNPVFYLQHLCILSLGVTGYLLVLIILTKLFKEILINYFNFSHHILWCCRSFGDSLGITLESGCLELTLVCLASMAISLLVVPLPLCSGDSLEQFSLTGHHMTLCARHLAVTVEASTMQFLLPQLP